MASERVPRADLQFHSSCPIAFEDLVSQTLGESEFIEVEHMDDGLVIHEVGGEDGLTETPSNAVSLVPGRTPEEAEAIRKEVEDE